MAVKPAKFFPSSKTALSAESARGSIRIGFVPVTDCVPLIAAQRLGLFDSAGLHVTLECEVGWAAIREKLVHGQLDAAHAVAGLVLALRLGLQGRAFPVLAPFVFSLQGNAVTLSRDLWQRGVRDAQSLRKLIRSQPERILTFGTVSRFSSHHCLLRNWLQSGGINPDQDVRILVFPPPLMAENMKAGLLDGFCSGEPWNSQAIAEGVGWSAATSADLSPLHPEKVLLLSESFAGANPNLVSVLCGVLTEACAYCDKTENRPTLVRWLAESGHFSAPAAVLSRSLVGPFEDGVGRKRGAECFHIFHRNGANVPGRDGAAWLLDEFKRHNLLPFEAWEQAGTELRAAWAPLKSSPTPPAVRPRRSKLKPSFTALPS